MDGEFSGTGRCRPHDRTVTALEADVLKLRILEMVLVLFYIESLEGLIINSIRITKHLRKILNSADPRTNSEEQISFKKAHELLILEGVTTQEESVQLKEVIDYRSTVGHKVHRMTIDIGAYLNPAKYDPPSGHRISEYDYSAIQRIRKFRKNVERKMMEKPSCFELFFNTLAFDAAEQTYLKEIKRLKKEIGAGVDKLNITIETANKVIRNTPREVMDTIQPGHLRNRKSNGTFSAEGAKGILIFYDVKATPLVASYMMRVSYHIASEWYKEWIKKRTRE